MQLTQKVCFVLSVTNSDLHYRVLWGWEIPTFHSQGRYSFRGSLSRLSKNFLGEVEFMTLKITRPWSFLWSILVLLSFYWDIVSNQTIQVDNDMACNNPGSIQIFAKKNNTVNKVDNKNWWTIRQSLFSLWFTCP